MRAILLKGFGGVEQFYIGQTAIPSLPAGHLLVRVAATALNGADLIQRQGRYPPPPGTTDIIGLEMAGFVEQIGDNCRNPFRIGDRVCGILPGGGYAQYCVIPEEHAFSLPDSLSIEQVAAVPEVFLTAFQALHWLGGLWTEPTETVLIHAGASGVGTAAIQLAKLKPHTKVFVTAGSQEKIDFCKSYGADDGINYKEQDFAKEIDRLTNGNGVDIIVDFIGADYFERNLQCLNFDGRLINLAMMSGTKVANLNLGPIQRKRLRIIGSTLRMRDNSYKARLTSEFVGYALPQFASGQLRPVVDCVFPWTRVAEAHEYMEKSQNKGKIVLLIDQPN